MRLIDADEFLVYANKHVHELNCSDEAKRELIEIWLDEQPTAYDVDKVTKKLEKSKQDIAIMLQTSDGTYSDYEYADGIELNKAKEIVKGGLNVGTED